MSRAPGLASPKGGARARPAVFLPGDPVASSRPPGALHLDDLPRLRCPDGGGALRFEGEAPAGWLQRGELVAEGGTRWPVEGGLARMYREEQVRGPDRLMRHIYDGLPFLHDPVVKTTLPIFQAGGTEGQLRNAYMRRLDLGSLGPRPDGQPVRILEVGCGAGANIGLIYRDLPRDLPVELWGMDLSLGMIRIARKKLHRHDGWYMRLLLGDAHRLPFPDDCFDRVFHVGGIGGFRDPPAALAELGRVAVPGTPIVVVDERLDPARPGTALNRLAFRAITFYDDDPHCPTAELPAQAVGVIEEQISRFYYCLTWRMP